MELQQADSRQRSHELERIVGNAKRASDFLKALAHESRLLMLCILAEGEKSVSELEELLDLRSRRCRSSWRGCAPTVWCRRGATARRSITNSPARKHASSSRRLRRVLQESAQALRRPSIRSSRFRGTQHRKTLTCVWLWIPAYAGMSGMSRPPQLIDKFSVLTILPHFSTSARK